MRVDGHLRISQLASLLVDSAPATPASSVKNMTQDSIQRTVGSLNSLVQEPLFHSADSDLGIPLDTLWPRVSRLLYLGWLWSTQQPPVQESSKNQSPSFDLQVVH